MIESVFRRLNDRKATILVVDDEGINAEILANGLKPLYDTKIATSGAQALEMVELSLPDLILLDIRMPKMDGYEVLKRLKSQPRFAEIPVVFVTGRDSADEEIKGLELGANDYVRKPFAIPLVLVRVGIQIELKRKTDLLNFLATADSLTGLANRRKFDERFELLIKEASREKLPLGIMLLDIDYFKQYNDSYGHAIGDTCLIEVSKALSQVVKRATDVVARVGGEEFALVTPNVNKEQLSMLSERIHAAIAALNIEHKDSKVSNLVTASIGATSLIPDNDMTSRELYSRVDKLLYRAKNSGRGITVFDD